MLRQEIISDLKKTLKKLGMIIAEPTLEHPSEETHGDYSTNAALSFKRQCPLKLGPLDLAKKIVENFPKTDYLEKIEAVAPGFINFWLKPDYLYNIAGEIVREGDAYGQTDLLKGKKIMVEFAHPNTHKMFHIGHLRNITTGESIVRLLEANGAKVIRANYQGDVGMHIAKCLYGISKLVHEDNDTVIRITVSKREERDLDKRIKFLGEAYVVGTKAFEEDEKAKKEIGEINKKIYKKDPEIFKLWQETRAWSLEYFERIYKRVDTTFDRLYFESECSEAGLKLASQGDSLQKKILEKSEGAIIFDGKPYGLDTRVFVNSQGFPTYEAKELALAKLEFSEFGKLDQLIHVVGPEQASFFKVTFKVEELLGIQKGEQRHLIYGWVRLKSGKMSSRTGEVVLGEWLLDEAKKRLMKKYKMEDETAEVVAVGAVKYSLLKIGLSSEIAFDIDESVNLEGDSGPYLQYTYARCQSVLRKAKDFQKTQRNQNARTSEIQKTRIPENSGFSGNLAFQISGSQSFPSVLESEELSLLRNLYRFPEIVASAGILYSPNLLCGYLFGLAQKYNLFYNKCPILQPQKTTSFVAVRELRLRLTKATGQILKNGLYLLGIKTVEKM